MIQNPSLLSPSYNALPNKKSAKTLPPALLNNTDVELCSSLVVAKPMGLVCLHFRYCTFYRFEELLDIRTLRKFRIECESSEAKVNTDWVGKKEESLENGRRRPKKDTVEINQILLIPVKLDGARDNPANSLIIRLIGSTQKFNEDNLPASSGPKSLLNKVAAPEAIGILDKQIAVTSLLDREQPSMDGSSEVVLGTSHKNLCGNLCSDKRCTQMEYVVLQVGKIVCALLQVDVAFTYGQFGFGHSNYFDLSLESPACRERRKRNQRDDLNPHTLSKLSSATTDFCNLTLFPKAKVPVDRLCPKTDTYVPQPCERVKLYNKNADQRDSNRLKYPILCHRMEKTIERGWNGYKKCQSRNERINYLNKMLEDHRKERI